MDGELTYGKLKYKNALEEWVHNGVGCIVPQAAYDALCRRPDNELLRRRVDEHMKALAAELAACGTDCSPVEKHDTTAMHQPMENEPEEAPKQDNFVWPAGTVRAPGEPETVFEARKKKEIEEQNRKDHEELRRMLGL